MRELIDGSLDCLKDFVFQVVQCFADSGGDVNEIRQILFYQPFLPLPPRLAL